MKVTITFVLMTTVVSVVFAGSLYDAKDEAKTAVNEKYKEAEDLMEKLKTDVENERRKEDRDSMKQAMKNVENKFNEAEGKLQKDAVETTKTAIAKGKPIQAISCIGANVVEGKNLIKRTNDDLKAAIENVAPAKLKKLDFLKIQLEFISKAMLDLKNQAISKIESMKDGFEIVKADAFKKFETAVKQMQEIDNEISKPNLFDGYKALKKLTDIKFKDVSDNLLKKLQKCIA